MYGFTKAKSLDNGLSNTKNIIKYNVAPERTAAYKFDTLKFEGYDDWYLPALNELRKIYDSQEVIRNFTIGDYCSSTEADRYDSWNIHFKPNKRIEFHYDKESSQYHIRCIRNF